jgi:hypothetical protein
MVMATKVMGAEFCVAPEGLDANPGTRQQPFATLARARDAARDAIQQKPNEDVTVLIRGGSHCLVETLVLDGRDSRAAGRTTTFAAYPGEKPILTSGVLVRGWRRLETLADGLPASARDKVWVADVPRTLPSGQPWRFRTLYDEGVRLPRARSAGFQSQGRYPLALNQCSTLRFQASALRNWVNLDDVEVLIRPSFPWVYNILPLRSVNETSRTAMTARPGTYPLQSHTADTNKPNCWVENVLEALDAPGKWVLNTVEGRLYLWPTDGMLAAGHGRVPDNRVTAPALVELVRVAGSLDAGEHVPDLPVRGIVFKGITFTGGDRYLGRADARGFQHDWAAVDQANALLRLRGAEECIVEDCEFTQSGACGVRLDLHCQRNRIEGNRIHHVGEHGIALCGYGPGTKDVNHSNRVLNNWIHDCGEIIWHAVGIYVAQSGSNHIAFNRIHDMPFMGITLSGARDFRPDHPGLGEGARSIRWPDFPPQLVAQWKQAYDSGVEPWPEFYPFLHARHNRVEGNELFDCVQVMGDGNAIYLSGAGDGNVIQRNFIHDLLGEGDQMALRADDLQQGTTFRENIVWNCLFGAVEHKHRNTYENNIFAGIRSRSPAGREWHEWAYMLLGRGPVAGTRIQRNIFFSFEDSPAFYRERAGTKLQDCQPDYNLFFCASDPGWSQQYLHDLQGKGLEQHSLAADPLFIAPEKGDFRLWTNSPAFHLGFRPIAVERIGIQSPWREKFSLPSASAAGGKPTGSALPGNQ